MFRERFWFIRNEYYGPVDLRTDPDYTGRVEYQFHEKDCTLRITDLRESDSAEYKFRFMTNQYGGSYTGSPGVTLTVTDLQVKRRKSSAHTELQCHSSCDVIDPPSYVWYKNGQKIEEETSLRVSVGGDDSSYSCAVKGHEGYRSAAVYVPKLPSVSVSPSAEIVEGSSVTLTCSSDANPAASYTWYKEDGQTPLSKEWWLSFSSIQPSDSGQYYCTAENDLGKRTSESIFIDVKYAPKPPSVSVRPSGEIKEGTSVTLTCSSEANPAATFVWYKINGRTPLSKERQLFFSSIQPSDSGQYYCIAANTVGSRTSEYVSINVKYAPKFVSVMVSPSNEFREGGSVTLICSSDANPAAQYSWYKKNGQKPLSSEQQLSFSSIQPSDSGEYYCTAQNKVGRKKSEYTSIDVKYAPKPPSVSVRPSGEIKEGGSVTLTCSSDANPAATFVWYKISGRTPLSEERQLVFRSIQPSDSGQYYCIAVNKLGRRTSEYISIDGKYAPKFVSVMVSPSNEFREGGSVTLICSSDANPAAQYSWYKKNGQKPLSSEQQLSFSSIQPSDSGEYYCRAQNKVGRKKSEYTSIDVKYDPKLPSVSVSPSGEIKEGTAVTLTCSSDANPAAQYSWYKKNGQKPLSNERQLSFSSIQSSDSEEYYCRAVNKLGSKLKSIAIDVKYAPKPPSVSVSPSGEIKENVSVTLTCSSDANPAAAYVWYKMNNQTPVSTDSQLSFSSIQPADSGEYYCTAENRLGTSTPTNISVDVKYDPKPPSVSVSPSGEITEGTAVTLTCSSDANPAATFVWYKRNSQPLSKNPQLIFNSIQSSDSGEYYCRAVNKLGSKLKSITIDVKYAPKPPSVSVSPSGEIKEGTSVTLTCSSDANP
ncbi:B-cell receptor CD22, partial [Haplochromis burtoni]|uniref:B-cell receptor CD22 n=1 Tax=Haplochromis burtoni TaxID=8153 RepID=UPI001C2CCA87